MSQRQRHSVIIHGDLHMGNILFDEKNNRFWPIDFSNSYEHYYSIDKDSKLF
ncbi:TPA: phosphotransferase, partial [Escherichia coli]